MTKMNQDKTVKYRDKAVHSHDFNSPVFFDRYEIMEKNPYASAFAYGRKKMFAKMDARIEKHLQGKGEVLEAACGTGYYLKHLGSLGYTMTGVEPAKGMRERAQKKNPNAEIKEGIISELPFPDNSFDAVTAIELFRYLEAADIKKGYEEILRVLRPGGIAVITLVNRYALDGFIFSYYAKLLMEKIFGKQIINYCDFVTPAEMRKIFAPYDVEVTIESALFAPLRLIYKISPKLGERCARKWESLDDALSQKAWYHKFAGHLIVTVKKKSQ